MTSTWWWWKRARTNSVPHTWPLLSSLLIADWVCRRFQKWPAKTTRWEIKVEWATNQMLWKERKSALPRWWKGKYLTKWSHSKTYWRKSTSVMTNAATDSKFDSTTKGSNRPSALSYKTTMLTLSISSLRLIASTSSLIIALRKLLITSSLLSASRGPLTQTWKSLHKNSRTIIRTTHLAAAIETIFLKSTVGARRWRRSSSRSSSGQVLTQCSAKSEQKGR